MTWYGEPCRRRRRRPTLTADGHAATGGAAGAAAAGGAALSQNESRWGRCTSFRLLPWAGWGVVTTAAAEFNPGSLWRMAGWRRTPWPMRAQLDNFVKFVDTGRAGYPAGAAHALGYPTEMRTSLRTRALTGWAAITGQPMPVLHVLSTNIGPVRTLPAAWMAAVLVAAGAGLFAGGRRIPPTRLRGAGDLRWPPLCCAG